MKTFLRSCQTSPKRSTWRRYVIVVAEQTDDGWLAWFRDTPEQVSVGNSDILAILTLIETFGSIDMDAWDMTKLEARSSDGHLEYLLPSRVG